MHPCFEIHSFFRRCRGRNVRSQCVQLEKNNWRHAQQNGTPRRSPPREPEFSHVFGSAPLLISDPRENLKD